MQQGGPYICNWMAGRDYCGKRYTSAEELLVHLKTHTSLSVTESGQVGFISTIFYPNYSNYNSFDK